jgi:hypothetical protein
MLRRGLITDLSIAFGAFLWPRFPQPGVVAGGRSGRGEGVLTRAAGIGLVFGNAFWYDDHDP